jgi:hypothetical protein
LFVGEPDLNADAAVFSSLCLGCIEQSAQRLRRIADIDHGEKRNFEHSAFAYPLFDPRCEQAANTSARIGHRGDGAARWMSVAEGGGEAQPRREVNLRPCRPHQGQRLRHGVLHELFNSKFPSHAKMPSAELRSQAVGTGEEAPCLGEQLVIRHSVESLDTDDPLRQCRRVFVDVLDKFGFCCRRAGHQQLMHIGDGCGDIAIELRHVDDMRARGAACLHVKVARWIGGARTLVYIEFPERIDQGEAPPLFVVGVHGGSELVNYRVRGNYYVVDQLFAAAELRLGANPQQVVRIDRTDAVRPSDVSNGRGSPEYPQ